MDELLPEALTDAFDKPTKEWKEDKPLKHKYPITTPLDWGLAFAAFAAAITHYHPSKDTQLLAYSGIIFHLVCEVGGALGSAMTVPLLDSSDQSLSAVGAKTA